jgi:hypothetical protein
MQALDLQERKEVSAVAAASALWASAPQAAQSRVSHPFDSSRKVNDAVMELDFHGQESHF